MEELADQDNEIQPLSPKEMAEIRSNIYRKLRLPATSGSVQLFPGGIRSWMLRTVAAAMLVCIAVPVYYWLKPAAAGKINKLYSLLEVRTGAEELRKITLPDSTIVLLNANSILYYSSNFQDQAVREVRLTGNAFFSVKKDRKHTPFIVRANETSITVLGTELNVNARSEETEVALASGKVKVAQAGNDSNAIFLQPGEKLKLDMTSRTFVKSEMNTQLYDAWTNGIWNFRQNTLEEITGLIREYYGTDIIFNKANSRHLRINAVLPVSGLQNLVAVIGHTLQIKIKLLNNQLIVQ